jgi:2-C-methyl-D-erythritol 2,4-cyclodiphosphate synthase
MRIGHGFDVHAFDSQRRLVLGGVTIPDHPGLAAHSDGDVVIHALCDSLLGAAALGDIGRHFPDNDPSYAGTDSRVLLRRVVELLRQQGRFVVNVDLTVVAQRPRLAPYVDDMRGLLAADLEVGIERVGLKATTSEGLGFTGRGEGIAVMAVALIDGE